MRGFLLGFAVAAALAFAGYHYRTHWMGWLGAPEAPTATADAGAPVKDTREKKKKRRRGASRVAREDGAGSGPGGRLEAEPEPVKLSAGDLKLVSQGDDISRPDVVHLGDATDDSGGHELSQDDIDARFRAKEDAILGCISKARPDEETYVPGRVTVKFRIQRTGNVRGVRVEAPAILQKGGLYGCVRGVVGGIRFPPSSGSQVVAYPFSLS